MKLSLFPTAIQLENYYYFIIIIIIIIIHSAYVLTLMRCSADSVCVVTAVFPHWKLDNFFLILRS